MDNNQNNDNQRPSTSGDMSSGSSNDTHPNNRGDGRVPPATGAIKKKREEKRTKRDQRSWDNLIKSLANLPESEKLEIIKEKYSDLYTEFRSASTALKGAEKTIKNLQREKEHVQADIAKHILSRSKLENLARELQKQNREIKEENNNRLREEEEKRKEVASNFTDKLSSLTQLMDESKDKSIRLREENINMTSKLTELYDQFQERETHLANMNKQMELQKKLSDTQLKKIEFEFETEREIWKKERSILVANLHRSDETNLVLQENVKSLQKHLDSYQKQYTDFETTMKRSNKVIDSFKDDMTKMQKANSVLEKDRNEWHGRWKGSTQKCLQLTELNQITSNELKTVQKKMDALEKLCRKLQAERSYYLQQLKLYNITQITPVEEESTSSVSTTASSSKEMLSTTNSNHLSSSASQSNHLSSSVSQSDSSLGDYASTAGSSSSGGRLIGLGIRPTQSEPGIGKQLELSVSIPQLGPAGDALVTYTADFDSSLSEITPNSNSDLSVLDESPRVAADYVSESPMESDSDYTPYKEEKTEPIDED